MGKNQWTKVYDENDLYNLLQSIDYFDENGDLLYGEDLHIFKDGNDLKDAEEFYRKLKKEVEENTWESL
jgi:hypothetical protein